MSVRILTGDCRELLATLPDESVHCVVTSPPYYGLRDYGGGGQPGAWGFAPRVVRGKGGRVPRGRAGGAGRLGLGFPPAEFVAAMVEVFREVRRVLRADGTAWVNMGDSYN